MPIIVSLLYPCSVFYLNMSESDRYFKTPLFLLKFVGFQLEKVHPIKRSYNKLLAFICLLYNEAFLLFSGHFVTTQVVFCLVNTIYNTIVKNNTFKKVYESIV